jgi:predicted nucleic acid-binding Zn ribbon protein
LPVDRPSTRRVVLVREGAGWVVAEVRDQDSAAASTSRTSSSSKS